MKNRTLTVGSIIFIIILTVLLSREVWYDQKIRSKSPYLYTIVKITDNYHQGDTRGMEIEYILNGITYKDHCSGETCLKSRISEKYIIKVFQEDPEIFEIRFDKRVNKQLVVPEKGWEKIPNNCCYP